MLTNPVFLSVILLTVLCLLKVNVLVAILISALAAGLIAGMPIDVILGHIIAGMGNNTEVALSYILLGSLAAAISSTGVADQLVLDLSKKEFNNKWFFLLLLGGLACFSQNLLPVHIAFIPILIPPLLKLFNRMQLDRRGVACALTFGLKTPYVVLPVGFGMIFHTVVSKALTQAGVALAAGDVWKATWIPGIGMLLGFLTAVFVSYRNPRTYKDLPLKSENKAVGEEDLFKVGPMGKWGVLVGAFAAFVIQIIFTNNDWSGGLPLGALIALVIMFFFRSFRLKDLDKLVNDGIGLMGFVAFVMLVAAGYAQVLNESGGVQGLVTASASLLGGSKLIGAIVMLLIGLIVTMGIGTSFGTVPIIASVFVPLGVQLGFSPLAIAALVAVAGALGDAGSPASDSTLGPTSGLNADGQHDHIYDTCIPTFLHYNIPLIIFGTIAAVFLL